MRPVHSSAVLALSLALALTACGADAQESPTSADSYADGKSFTLAIGTDPGKLDPQASPVSAALQLGRFAYDSLVTVDGEGEIEPNLATSWEVDGTKVTFEIGEKPMRFELVHLAGDSFITVEAHHGIHIVFAFIGRDAAGRAQHVHYGRVVSRAD